jgi:ankyrin repeat protein
MTSSKAAFHVPPGADETLHAAAYAGNKARVHLFLTSGGGTAGSRDEDGRTPIHWACAGGHGK